MNKSREDLATIYDVDPSQITQWFRFTEDDAEIPEVALTEPIHGWEMMAVARRRMGVTIDDLAEQQGISHVTLIRREKGSGDWRESWAWWTGKVPPPIGGKRQGAGR